MALAAGTRLGPYEIAGLLGVGGMGEVYRATDTNLKRQVAIKVLPESLGGDLDRLARFQREAEVLASLNHSNIAAIYGLERAGGQTALVMELVEGPTLADRIVQNPVPVDEALQIARQIADALEAAHEQGVIHRDLKPANIKVRPDGTVKVLDFGLARAVEPGSSLPGSVTQSPTLTSPAMTQAGMILGTAAYMAPEQARGKPVDKGADIWAFGCVLYEMLAGRRTFEGESVSETLACVLEREPDWGRLPSSLAGATRLCLVRCLQKRTSERIRDMGDVRLLLDGAFTVSDARIETAWWRRQPIAIAVGAAALVLVAASATLSRAPAAPAATIVRTTLDGAGAAPVAINGFGSDIAITPDGTRVVYYAAANQILVRHIDELQPRRIFSGARPGTGIFVSPNGQWVGFTERTALQRVPVGGGPPAPICIVDGTGIRGALWADDDTIIFATTHPDTGLQRVPATGGTPTVITRPDHGQGEADHLWPAKLPGSRAVLFTITAMTGSLEDAQIAVLDLETGTRKLLLRGSHPQYVGGAYLVYVSNGVLYAAAFDANALEVTGEGVPVTNTAVVTTTAGAANVAIADNGTMAYVGRSETATDRTLTWVDRGGIEERIPLPPRAYLSPRVSPDGSMLALHVADRQEDVWLWEFRKQTLARFTLSGQPDRSPLWTADGQRLLFASRRDARVDQMYQQRADGTGTAERLHEGGVNQSPTSVSRDGRFLVFHEVVQSMARNLMLLDLNPPRTGRPLLATPAEERNGVISPDTRWLAYESDESGRFEIHVRPFPSVDSGQWQVSTTGGTQPLWSRDGAELFFFDGLGALQSVRVVPRGLAWTTESPKTVLPPGYYRGDSGWLRSYDVSPDGRRFLMIKDSPTSQPSLVLVQHWAEELRRLLPTN